MPFAVTKEFRVNSMRVVRKTQPAQELTPPMTSLLAWYDASKTGNVSLDGSNKVISWSDSTGNGNTLTASSTGLRPTYVTAGLLGKNTVSFTGGQCLKLSSLSLDRFTIFCMMKASSNGIVFEHSTDGWNNPGCYVYSTTFYSYAINRSGNQYSLDVSNDWLLGNVWRKLCARNSATGRDILTNGSSRASGGAAISSTATNPFFVGGRNDGGLFITGQYAEILVYNAGLNDTEVAAVNDYLSSKWEYVATPSFTGTYSSAGDTNGFIYYIGTLLNGGTFANPDSSVGGTLAFASSTGNGVTSEVTNRASSSEWHTNGSAGQWLVLDLGYGRTFRPNVYTLQNGTASSAFAIRNWKLQGSNNVASNDITGVNAATWTDIDVRVNDTTMTTSNASWATYSVTQPATGYRWFRVLSTGLNANNTQHLVVGEIELYGTNT